MSKYQIVKGGRQVKTMAIAPVHSVRADGRERQRRMVQGNKFLLLRDGVEGSDLTRTLDGSLKVHLLTIKGGNKNGWI
jgi:hypothetical protein